MRRFHFPAVKLTLWVGFESDASPFRLALPGRGWGGHRHRSSCGIRSFRCRRHGQVFHEIFQTVL